LEKVTGPGDFTVSANEPTGNTGVMMYPSLYQVWRSSKRVAYGLLDHGTTFNSIGFGREVCSTGGVSESFEVSNFSMKLAAPGV
jgi:hypothetical protein